MGEWGEWGSRGVPRGRRRAGLPVLYWIILYCTCCTACRRCGADGGCIARSLDASELAYNGGGSRWTAPSLARKSSSSKQAGRSGRKRLIPFAGGQLPPPHDRVKTPLGMLEASRTATKSETPRKARAEVCK